MWDSERMELLRISIRVLVIAVFVAFIGFLLASHQALGYLVREAEPGIVEIAEGQTGALRIGQVVMGPKHKWVYFTVVEKTRLSSRLGAGSTRVRYFYARAKDFSLTPNMKVHRLQFGTKKRINNAKGRIPFGRQKFFYPVVDLKTLS